MRLSTGAPRAAFAIAALLLAGCGSSASGPKGASKVGVTLVDSGCTPSKINVASGPVTFEITNGGTSKVSEMELKNNSGIILGEAENVVEGVPGHFSLNLGPGAYVVNCPNGSQEDQGKLVATGKTVSQAKGALVSLLAMATASYKAYVIALNGAAAVGHQEIRRCAAGRRYGEGQDTVLRPDAAALRGDRTSSRELRQPRPRHRRTHQRRPERQAVDGLSPDRAHAVGAEHDEGHGGVYATKLMDDVNTLVAKVKTIQLQPAQLANGAVELMNEVANSKITGEEDRYSHTDLSDFQGNLSGSREAFDLLKPALGQTGNAQLAATIDQRFAAVQKSLDRYKRNTALGFAVYNELTPADRQVFAREVDSLDEPLLTIAAKVSGA